MIINENGKEINPKICHNTKIATTKAPEMSEI